MILISSWSRLCPILWSQVLSREWRCSWSSADRRCSNYIWVIDSLIAYQGATYIRDLTINGIDLVFLEYYSTIVVNPSMLLQVSWSSWLTSSCSSSWCAPSTHTTCWRRGWTKWRPHSCLACYSAVVTSSTTRCGCGNIARLSRPRKPSEPGLLIITLGIFLTLHTNGFNSSTQSDTYNPQKTRPVLPQVMTWCLLSANNYQYTSGDLLTVGPLGTNFTEILIKFQTFSMENRALTRHFENGVLNAYGTHCKPNY